MDTIEITRAELYREVWQRPMLQVARDYGLSDVGLAKLCRRHDIPCPPRGYWAKKQHGHRPSQPPLPDAARDEPIVLTRGTPNAPLGDDRTPREAIHVELAENLRGAHQLVRAAKAELTAAKVGADGILILPAEALLQIQVSKGSLRRALLITDAILRSVEAAGHTVSQGPQVTVDGARVGFTISETSTVQREAIDDHDLNGRYTFGHSRFSERMTPTGQLTLHILADTYCRDGLQQTWRDTSKQRLEDRLENFVARLLDVARHIKKRQEQLRLEAERRREEEEQRQNEARRRAERRELQKTARAQVDRLLQKSSDWHTAQQLREYIAAIQAHFDAQGRSTDPEAVAWLDWASQQADRLDPLRPSPPSILDEDLGPENPPVQRWRGW